MDPLEEIARLRARAAPPDPLEEIRQIRERIARIEQAALAATTPTEGAKPMDIESALAAKYKDADAKATTRALASWGPFVPNPAIERTIAARAAHPDAYGPPDFAEAIYADRKRAAAAAKGATE